MKPKTYLCGPITGLSFSLATDWREKAKQLLKNIECLSPMRDSRYLEGLENIPASQAQHESLVMASNKGIFLRDRTDCINSRALLAFYPAGCGYSVGTAMEIAWAHLLHIPVVAVADKGNINRQHPMLSEACLWVDTLEDGCEVIRSILNK